MNWIRVSWLLTMVPGCWASGEVSGGVPIPEEAPAPDDASASGDVMVAAGPCADAGDRGDGATFTDLYRDFFGPKGLASCSAGSLCHVPMGRGAQISGGYVCVGDQASCWASMTSTLVPEGGTSSPETTTLYKALRKPGSGSMPRGSTFTFCPGDLARIDTWISSGARND